ncbi:Nuclear transport factor 2 [Linum grandiflorum]
MAMETANPSIHSAQTVGNAFVEQYYHILHTSPELVYRFYHDSSVLSRPDAKGEMTSVLTMQGINDKILSLNFKDQKAEIKTADAQKSYKDGVTVLVTGCLTGKDNLRRKFAQSFFLAPQDNGYFVLNDVFRYVEDNESLDNNPVSGGIDDTLAVPPVPDPEPSHVPDPSAPDSSTSVLVEDNVVGENEKQSSNYEKQLQQEKEIIVEPQYHSNRDQSSVVDESVSSAAQEDAPKKSYASIVKVAKGIPVKMKVYVPTNATKAPSKKIEDPPAAVAPVLESQPTMRSSDDAQQDSFEQHEVEGHSIYIRNLPQSVTVSQLEVAFKTFGPIKEEGVQVRYNKQQGYCFGFVDFQSPSSMDSAIQASPVMVGGRQAVVEMKRASIRAGNSGRGRFGVGRGGYRNDNSFRGRGNYYSGGRGYGRSEFNNNNNNRGEYPSGRGRFNSSGGRGEGYHQQGRGRGGGANANQENNA